MTSADDLISRLGGPTMEDVGLRLETIQRLKDQKETIDRLLAVESGPHFETWLSEALIHVRAYAQAYALGRDENEASSAMDKIVETLRRMEPLQSSYDTLRMMLDIYDDKTKRAQEAVKNANAERDHWKANHDNQVERARVLTERIDIPLQRIDAYKLLENKDETIAHLESIITAYKLASDQLTDIKGA